MASNRMLKWTTVLFFVIVLAANVRCEEEEDETAEILTWCAKSAAEAATCQSMIQIFRRIDPHNHTWACYTADSEEACITAIQNKQADFVSVDSGDIYSAFVKHGFLVVAQEQNAEGGPEYWGVAVARASECSSKTTLKNFKRKNSCHTGYRRASGWLLPIWKMTVNSSIIPAINMDAKVNNDIESVEAYFDKVCAPGDSTSGQVCSLCPSACEADTSAYVSYSGALNCLMNGGGDIAFTKNGIAEDYASDGSKKQTWSSLPSKDLKLVCPQGGCADLSAYKTCNFGTISGHAIITRKDIDADEPEEIIELLNVANSDSAFIELFLSGTNVNDFIFKADTQRFVAVYPKTVQQYLGDEYSVYTDVQGLDSSIKLGTSSAVKVGPMLILSLIAAFAWILLFV